MIHYHGGPITPDTAAIEVFTGRHGFVSHWEPRQIYLVAEVCQSFAVDNGAFAAWKSGNPISDWSAYYTWVASWRNHPGFDFAVVPDVIGGSEKENDDLAKIWPFKKAESAVVWHTNESVDRLVTLCKTWPRVAIGSSAEFDVSSPKAFLNRMDQVLPFIITSEGYPITKLHGLRQLNPSIYTKLPLSSADSSNIARNIGLDSKWRGTYQPKSKKLRAAILVERIESFNSSCHFVPRWDL